MAKYLLEDKLFALTLLVDNGAGKKDQLLIIKDPKPVIGENSEVTEICEIQGEKKVCRLDGKDFVERYLPDALGCCTVIEVPEKEFERHYS